MAAGNARNSKLLNYKAVLIARFLILSSMIYRTAGSNPALTANGSPNPINNDLLGQGIEAGVGAGPLGVSVTKPVGSNYLMFTIPFGVGLDFGLTNWNVETYK